ncbi:MAG: AMP-binding protein [Planctomycetota bacterium]
MGLLRRIMWRAVTHPARVAVIDDQRTYNFLKITVGALHVARALEQATDRDKVGIMLPTSGAFPITLLGAWLAKKVPVPLNYLLSQDELAHVVQDSGIDTIVSAGKMLEALAGMNLDIEALPGPPTFLKLEELNFKGVPPLRFPPKMREDQLAVLLYTSGTSGKPKGVMLSEHNIHTNIDDCLEHAGLTKCDSFLGVLPQFHTFGLTVLTLLPLYGGGTAVYTARFVPRKIIDLIRKHQPKLFIGVPSMLGALMNVKNTGPDDWKSLRYVISGGEPLPNNIHDGFLEKLNVEILEGYGLTETSPVTNWSTADNNKLHSVGRSLPRVRNVIVDDDNHVLGPNQEGEILIAGPNVMQGYYNLPDLTDDVIINLDLPPTDRHPGGPTRCFRTGDIGKLDDEGFLFITGRKKEMLIIAGENVFPREIEEVLNKHPDVHASAVIGKPDESRGEVPVAFVEMEEGAEFDAAALRAYCREGMAPFKVPKEVIRLDELPRNPTGKILRRELKAD